MGRYRAPPDDAPPDDDDGQEQEEATAMDWHATYDSTTACCLEGQDVNADEEEEYSHMNNCKQIRCRHSLLLENERSETTMHYSNLQRGRTLITVVAALAMITSLFLLQRYAPPPPAAIMLNQSPFRSSTTSHCTNDDATTVCDYAGYIHSADHNSSADYSAGATANHHKTWASFSHQLMRYVSSVAWYALSNSFRYAWDESRLGYMTFWHEIQLVWSSAKMRESLLAIITSVESHLLRMQAMSRLHTAATDEMQQQKNHLKLIDEEISKILSRVPAAHGYRRTQRDTADSNNIIMGTTAWSTEDYLRQTIGTSLSPQNLALKIISERIDAWVIVSRSDDVDISYIHNDTNITSKFNLPPAIGILIVGPEGVGKLRTARRLANYLLPGNNSLEDKVLSGDGGGVLEINVDTRDNVDRLQTSVTETIVNYIYQREEHGSVIIIHHIELMPIPIMTDIANVLSGNHNTISYQASNGTTISTSCNGTLFVLTSLQIGARSILQNIKQNHGLKHLNKELLVESVRRELNDYPFEYSSKLASHATIAPITPFQEEDLLGLLQSKVQKLNLQYQGVCWMRLEVSLATIRYFVGSYYVEYSDLLAIHDMSVDIEDDKLSGRSFTFSTRGAFALDQNSLLRAIESIAKTGNVSRLDSILKIGVDNASKEIISQWCSFTDDGLESCEVESHS